MGVKSLVASALVFAAGTSYAAPPEAGWVVLRISRVRVKPTKVDGTAWDLPKEKSNGSGCQILGLAGAAVLGPTGGLATTYLCSQSGGGQRERDPKAPDLFVQLTAGDAVYRTPVALDTYEQAFDFPIVVPLDAVPSTGLELQVLDQDQDVRAGELIGMVRVARQQLADASHANNPLITLADSQVDRIEVEVTPYVRPEVMTPTLFSVNQEPAQTKSRVRAGELVEIAAHGTYSVADSGDQLDENGYTSGAKRGYNRPEFEKANHAEAIAYIGAPSETHSAVVVGSCVRVVSSVAGAMFVGVNDNDLSNNKGNVEFSIETRLPTIDEWRSGGASVCPKPAVASAGSPPVALDSSSLSPAEVLAKIQRAYMAGIRRCYKDYLRKDPKAKGKVAVSLSVDQTGRTTRAIASGFPGTDVNDCITGQMASWRFPVPKDESGKPTEASFSITLQLQPD